MLLLLPAIISIKDGDAGPAVPLIVLTVQTSPIILFFFFLFIQVPLATLPAITMPPFFLSVEIFFFLCSARRHVGIARGQFSFLLLLRFSTQTGDDAIAVGVPLFFPRRCFSYHQSTGRVIKLHFRP